MKLESKITAELQSQNRLPVGAWEVKRTTNNSLPFKSFAQHQIDSLLKAKRSRLNVKIRDAGVFKKPFDGLTLEKTPAWCVCCYPEGKGYTAYAIDIEVWYLERRTCGRKSMTKERASQLGEKL